MILNSYESIRSRNTNCVKYETVKGITKNELNLNFCGSKNVFHKAMKIYNNYKINNGFQRVIDNLYYFAVRYQQYDDNT